MTAFEIDVSGFSSGGSSSRRPGVTVGFVDGAGCSGFRIERDGAAIGRRQPTEYGQWLRGLAEIEASVLLRRGVYGGSMPFAELLALPGADVTARAREILGEVDPAVFERS